MIGISCHQFFLKSRHQWLFISLAKVFLTFLKSQFFCKPQCQSFSNSATSLPPIVFLHHATTSLFFQSRLQFFLNWNKSLFLSQALPDFYNSLSKFFFKFHVLFFVSVAIRFLLRRTASLLLSCAAKIF